MADVYKNIKKYRLQSGLTLLEVAKKLGVQEATVQRYESGKIRNLKYETIVSLAEIFNCSPVDLMGWEDDVDIIKSYTRFFLEPEVRKLPVLGKIACGEPIYAEENIDFVAVKDAPSNADFILIANGDSMINANIHDGDYVFIKKQPIVQNGEIAAVIIEDEATLKRVYFDKENQTMTLVAENSAYAPLVYSGDRLENIKILGKALFLQTIIK